MTAVVIAAEAPHAEALDIATCMRVIQVPTPMRNSSGATPLAIPSCRRARLSTKLFCQVQGFRLTPARSSETFARDETVLNFVLFHANC
jgi:hypothetical protein